MEIFRVKQVAVIIGVLAFLGVPFFVLPQSFAVAPTVSQDNATDQVGTTAITSIFPGHTAVGDLIVVQIMENQTGSTALTVRDNASHVYTLVTSENSTGSPYVYTAIYYTFATANAGLVIILNSSASTSLGLFIYDITGITAVSFRSAVGTGGGCGCGINPQVAAPANSISIAGAVSAAHKGANTWGFTSGFFGTSSVQQVSAGEFATPTGNMLFDMNFHPPDVNSWAEAAAVFFQTPAVTTGGLVVTSTTYVGPDPISINFWLFPMMFLLIFGGIFMVVGFTNNATQADTIFMTLLGIITGSFIVYAMNMLPFGFIVGEVVLFIIFVWRGTT